MAGQEYFFNSSCPNWLNEKTDQEYWPVTNEPSARLTTGRDPANPDNILSLPHGAEICHPSKSRSTLNRFVSRLKKSRVPGSELAMEYLQEKYNKNLTSSTICQSGGVILSFCLFLQNSRTDFFQLTNKDIARFVERDQDKGLKSGAIRTKLRALYALGFLFDKEILPYTLLQKKIRIKPEEPLPKAIADVSDLWARTDCSHPWSLSLDCSFGYLRLFMVISCFVLVLILTWQARWSP